MNFYILTVNIVKYYTLIIHVVVCYFNIVGIVKEYSLFFNIDIYNKRTNMINILFIDISTSIIFLCGQYSITTC